MDSDNLVWNPSTVQSDLADFFSKSLSVTSYLIAGALIDVLFPADSQVKTVCVHGVAFSQDNSAIITVSDGESEYDVSYSQILPIISEDIALKLFMESQYDECEVVKSWWNSSDNLFIHYHSNFLLQIVFQSHKLSYQWSASMDSDSSTRILYGMNLREIYNELHKSDDTRKSFKEIVEFDCKYFAAIFENCNKIEPDNNIDILITKLSNRLIAVYKKSEYLRAKLLSKDVMVPTTYSYFSPTTAQSTTDRMSSILPTTASIQNPTIASFSLSLPHSSSSSTSTGPVVFQTNVQTSDFFKNQQQPSQPLEAVILPMTSPISITNMSLPRFTMTTDVKNLIASIVKIDTMQMNNKIHLFNRLFLLWEKDLLDGYTTETMFEENRMFVRRAILDSYEENDRDAEQIYYILDSGQSYQTKNKTIIPSNASEIDRFKKHHNKISKRVNSQFNRLVREFNEFLKNKNNFIYNPIKIAPMEVKTSRTQKTQYKQPILSSKGSLACLTSSTKCPVKRKRCCSQPDSNSSIIDDDNYDDYENMSIEFYQSSSSVHHHVEEFLKDELTAVEQIPQLEILTNSIPKITNLQTEQEVINKNRGAVISVENSERNDNFTGVAIASEIYAKNSSELLYILPEVVAQKTCPENEETLEVDRNIQDSDIKIEFIQVLLLLLKENTNSNDMIKFSTRDKIANFYNQNRSRIKNNIILDLTITNAVIDLTNDEVEQYNHNSVNYNSSMSVEKIVKSE